MVSHGSAHDVGRVSILRAAHMIAGVVTQERAVEAQALRSARCAWLASHSSSTRCAIARLMHGIEQVRNPHMALRQVFSVDLREAYAGAETPSQEALGQV